MRQDVFDNLVVAQEKFGASMLPEAKRYVERHIKLGRRNGTYRKTEDVYVLKLRMFQRATICSAFCTSTNCYEIILCVKFV